MFPLYFPGRRSCIGESFSKLMIFTTMTSVLQRFKVKKVKGQSYSIDSAKSLVSKPHDYVLQAEERSLLSE